MPDLWRPALADFVQAAAVILEIDPTGSNDSPACGSPNQRCERRSQALAIRTLIPSSRSGQPVLIEHLARNHPLPDGNKRVSFALMILFLERNGQRWGDPDHDRDVHMVEQIASGQAHRSEVLEWIAARLT